MTRPEAVASHAESERLAWLAGRSPGPLAGGLGADATPATLGHPMGPEALVRAVGEALRDLHGLDVAGCALTADTAALRMLVDERIAEDAIPTAVDGPYAGRRPAELAALFDELIADVGPDDRPVFIHAGLDAARVWFEPAGAVTFTGWERSGVGDRHLDLAAAAVMASSLYGPALVAPLFDVYGLDAVDLRRLDAHQLLAHLLA